MAVIEQTRGRVVTPFTLADWKTQETAGGLAYQGVRGTWFDLRTVKVKPKGFLTLLCCPECATIFALKNKVHTIDDAGNVKERIACTKGTCDFRSFVSLSKWNKKPIYAVAIERMNAAGEWVPEMHHTHALNEYEAKKQCAGLGGTYRIIGAAPAIGWFEGAVH